MGRQGRSERISIEPQATSAQCLGSMGLSGKGSIKENPILLCQEVDQNLYHLMTRSDGKKISLLLYFLNFFLNSMWIQAHQLQPILNHHWYTTSITESNAHYEMYHDHVNIDVYTLRFNLNSLNFSEENMIDTMMSKVMNRFPNAESVVGMIGYDLLLAGKDPREKSFYIFRANSNQRLSARTEETVLSLDQHELYLFARKATRVHLNDLSIDFQSSDVTIAAVLSIVFSFFA
jgi:hypothetical protein